HARLLRRERSACARLGGRHAVRHLARPAGRGHPAAAYPAAVARAAGADRRLAHLVRRADRRRELAGLDGVRLSHCQALPGPHPPPQPRRASSGSIVAACTAGQAPTTRRRPIAPARSRTATSIACLRLESAIGGTASSHRYRDLRPYVLSSLLDVPTDFER